MINELAYAAGSDAGKNNGRIKVKQVETGPLFGRGHGGPACSRPLNADQTHFLISIVRSVKYLRLMPIYTILFAEILLLKGISFTISFSYI